MGFWSGIVNLLQGEPVFSDASRQHQGRDNTSQPTAVERSAGLFVVSDSSRKVIPEVTIKHCKTHVSGNEIDVTAWVTNTTAVKIELDKIVMLGVTLQIDRFLNPGESRQMRLCKTSIQRSDAYHTASLYYKRVSTGDYFCADFRVEYSYDPKGLYLVEELHPILPIRDI